ncbi:MAG: hypothetical protein KKH12_07600 [Gammaproteobacteria bacterium]|nr:hypothetical protein [Gammaproteobacteria bacterium]MBU1481525.1 hypothetical protein [Gammaproteobacteria bacterium]
MVLPVLVFFPLQALAAETPGKPGAAKTLSGISIVGNNEAPKSLVIVPWKSSEIGSDSGLHSGLMDDSMKPVDREVFMRELDFYEIRKGK